MELVDIVHEQLATPAVVKGWRRGIKCAYLVKESTTTRMQFTKLDKGRHSTKSMDIICQAAVDTFYL
jgi:hypothetical protein